ncbi:MAG: FAD-dependent oxidoreductase [Pseudomonadota bacterium]
MRKQLVLVGGGHAHMMVLENISQFITKKVKVTVIGPSSYHYYSGMGPGMLGGTYRPEDIRFATQKVVQHQGGVFIKDSVVKIDPVTRQVLTLSGHSFAYDLISFNSGSYVPIHAVNSESTNIAPVNLGPTNTEPSNPESNNKYHNNIYPVKPIEKLMEAAEQLKLLFKQKKIHVSIVGGGPSSAEIAGNVWQLAKKTKGHLPDITIYSGHKFMARFSDNIRSRMIRALIKKGIQINETGYVKTIKTDEITLESGQVFSTDFIFMASGVKPSTIFEASGLPTGPDKGLLVNSYLQSVKYPQIFGGGDCIYFEKQPLDKVGVYAVRQNPILLHNLLASIDGHDLKEFKPGPEYLLIFNAGGGIGVLKKKGLVFGGRPAFWIKDYIDRKFMKKFQAIEKGL